MLETDRRTDTGLKRTVLLSKETIKDELRSHFQLVAAFQTFTNDIFSSKCLMSFKIEPKTIHYAKLHL